MLPKSERQISDLQSAFQKANRYKDPTFFPVASICLVP